MDKKMETRRESCLLDRQDVQFLAAGIDNRLRARDLQAFSTHLLACAVCRQAAHDLRRILSASDVPPPPCGLAARILRSVAFPAGERWAGGCADRGGERGESGASWITFSRKGE